MKLLIEENPLMVQPSLVMKLGSISRAIVLQQMHWLLQQPHTGTVDEDGNKWIWGTMAEWCELYFPMWGESNLKRHIRWLREEGYLIVEQLNKKKISAKNNTWDRTNYYRIDYDRLNAKTDDESNGHGDDGGNTGSDMPKGDKCHPSKGRGEKTHPPKGEYIHPSKKGEDPHPSLYTDTSTETSVAENARERAIPPDKTTLPEWINPTAWREFEQHRKEIRKPMSKLARKKAWNQLRGLTHDEQQQVIDYSITGRYTGLFPDRLRRTGGQVVNRQIALEERNRQAVADWRPPEMRGEDSGWQT